MSVEPLTVDLETADFLGEAGGEMFTLCYQCGVCTGTCPWNLVRKFDVRKMIHQAELGLADFEDEIWWLCTTCRACVQRCPQEVEVIDIMRALHRIIVGLGAGRIPDSIRVTLKIISATGNPLG